MAVVNHVTQYGFGETEDALSSTSTFDGNIIQDRKFAAPDLWVHASATAIRSTSLLTFNLECCRPPISIFSSKREMHRHSIPPLKPGMNEGETEGWKTPGPGFEIGIAICMDSPT